MHRLVAMFVLGGALAFVSVARGAAPFEPNDSPNSAFGPIVAGASYPGAFETENDSDYFFFYLSARTQAQYQLVTPASNHYYDSVAIYHVRLNGDLEYESSLEVEVGHTGTAAITLDRGKYIALVCSGSYCADAETGDKYSFKILPAGITSTYEPFAAECAAARGPAQAAATSLAAAERRLAEARARLHIARNRGARRRTVKKLQAKVNGLKAKVAARKASFKSAAATEAFACSVPQ